MACKKEHVPFSGTPEQEAALKKVIAELKDTKGALMPIMQQAQEIYGYLRRMYPRRPVLSGFLPLRRRLRTGPGHDDQ